MKTKFFPIAALVIASAALALPAQGQQVATAVALKAVVTDRGSDLTAEQVQGITDKFREWTIDNKRGELMPQKGWKKDWDRAYSLYSSAPKRFLQYEEQTLGINLGWTESKSAETEKSVSRWFFTRQGSSTGPIRYGEKIAMGYGRKEGSYVRYDDRTFGINLNWSAKPVYEWMILGGTPGDVVTTGKVRVIIYNTKNQQPLIYFDRSGPTGNIGWPDSKTWSEAAKDWLSDKARKLAEKYGKEALSILVAAAVAAL